MTITERQAQRLTVGLYVVVFIATLMLITDPPICVWAIASLVLVPYALTAVGLLLGEMLTRHKAQF